MKKMSRVVNESAAHVFDPRRWIVLTMTCPCLWPRRRVHDLMNVIDTITYAYISEKILGKELDPSKRPSFLKSRRCPFRHEVVVPASRGSPPPTESREETRSIEKIKAVCQRHSLECDPHLRRVRRDSPRFDRIHPPHPHRNPPIDHVSCR